MNEKERVVKELKELARDCRWVGNEEGSQLAGAYHYAANMVERSTLVDPKECAGKGEG